MALTLAACMGCAAQTSALRTENEELRLQVAELKSDRRRDRREIRDLEKQIALLRGGKAKRGARSRGGYGLPVQVVEPDRDDDIEIGEVVAYEDVRGEVAYVDDDIEIIYAGDAAEDAAVRPSIKLYESDRSDPPPVPAPARSEPIAVDERLGVKQDVPPIPKPGATPPAAMVPAAADDDPRELYRRYYEALRAGNHNFAIVGFRSFTERFPKHDYADNAQYWLGEAYYDQQDYRAALAEFRAVVDRYPRGNKVADAMLKTAFCYQQLGYLKKAHTALVELVAAHPKTNAAALAEKRLAALEPNE